MAGGGDCDVGREGGELAGLLTKLQRQLFVLGSDLATPLGSKNEAKVTRVSAGEVGFLEEQIDAATAKLPALKSVCAARGDGGGGAAARGADGLPACGAESGGADGGGGWGGAGGV